MTAHRLNYIVIDRDDDREYVFEDCASAQQKLVGLCSVGIAAYMVSEQSLIPNC